MRRHKPARFDSFNLDQHDFNNMKRRGDYFAAFVILLMAGIICFNAYQYNRAPECNNGALIRDDGGRFICVPTNQIPLILRK